MIPITITAHNGNPVAYGDAIYKGAKGQTTYKSALITKPDSDERHRNFELFISEWPEESGAIVNIRAIKEGRDVYRWVKGDSANKDVLQADQKNKKGDDMKFTLSQHKEYWIFQWAGDTGFVSNQKSNQEILMANQNLGPNPDSEESKSAYFTVKLNEKKAESKE